MSGPTIAVVLLAALLHATWNALVKAGPDKLLSTVVVTSGAGLLAVPLLPFAGMPAPASWPWLAASAVCQVVYYRLLALAYRHGDMSQAYPLMRGTAPLLVVLASGPLLGEVPSAGQGVAIALICGGVLAMTLGGGASRRSSAYALANAVCIAAYTLVDGIGVRASGAPAAYTLWLFVLTALGMLPGVAGTGRGLAAYARRYWRTGLAGGCGTMASYGLALWAMTRAPVAMVAALRETSILFATLIALYVLRERVSGRRIAAAGLIACGAVAMRLAR
ncbi:putative membrane protein [Pseudoduganella lurida]|uniref:Putative membrane protein n=1 Tax=Pseudoduganella lurida TaxID=1036180 RepID=A0A562R8M4_9BURK|nr:DMT family transporter [Pseudoduganella lurida]TWI65233.1 putative membrane protein [Pseudoduganella lurida]